MPVTFSGAELIDIATGIERRGIAFYDVMAASLKDENAQEVFRMLAEMERTHLETFEKMRADASKYPAPGVYPQADSDYIQALLQTAVFTDEFVTSEFASHVENDRGAIELGIQAEKDSVLFYCQMRESLPPDTKHVVEEILAEERKHLTMLSAVKNLVSL